MVPEVTCRGPALGALDPLGQNVFCQTCPPRHHRLHGSAESVDVHFHVSADTGSRAPKAGPRHVTSGTMWICQVFQACTEDASSLSCKQSCEGSCRSRAKPAYQISTSPYPRHNLFLREKSLGDRMSGKRKSFSLIPSTGREGMYLQIGAAGECSAVCSACKVSLLPRVLIV